MSISNKHLIILFVAAAVAFSAATVANAKPCGDSCNSDDDCDGKLACVSQQCGDDPDMETSICGAPKFPKGCSKPCQLDDDCPGQLACMSSACADDPAMGTQICTPPPESAPAPDADEK